ncbi:uncharacterized protein MKK02DRAFT_39646 [Dioszegia hungarica]|uniref:Uncharacterized protein n=1 Tax=Dioszegia hungarica TaxID=4972 RepID=A0AA38LYM9_9TREE|nr:uncharacterized protein MKK02DRAFT_39646 [Dioszegia hungarica]KAI9639346.1 hypothetical protein MKK02DRAFT_39646 [Dioszegia hungarica]
MPAAAYLPDPGKWIAVAPPPSRGKQRPLVAHRHGFPTPPASNPRHRSSSVSTNENLPAVKPTAGPSRLGESKQGGLSGWLTPPTTSSQPRKRIDRVKQSLAESNTARGSPLSRSAAPKPGRVLGKPAGSRLAGKVEINDYWKSEEEDEIEADEEELPRAGPSRLPARGASPTQKRQIKEESAVRSLPPGRILSRNAFSSGELSDLPSAYCTSDEDDIKASSPRPPQPTVPAIPPAVPPSLAPRLNAHLDPTQGTTHLYHVIEPDLSQRPMTQAPPEELAMLWRINGMSTDRIEGGEVPWGKSAGYQQTEQLKKLAAGKRREALAKAAMGREDGSGDDTELDEAIETMEEAVEVVARAAKKSARRAKRGVESGAGVNKKEEGSEGTSAKRVPLSPMGINGRKGIRKMPPGSPTPRKSTKRRRVEVRPDSPSHPPAAPPSAAPANPVHAPKVDSPPPRRSTSPLPPSPHPVRALTPLESASSPPSETLDLLLNPLVEEARRDAMARDIQRTQALRPLSRALRCRTPTPEPLPPRSSRHHSVTPPKLRPASTRRSPISFDSSPSPQPTFPSPPPGAPAGPRDFEAVDRIETLYSYSFSVGAPGSSQLAPEPVAGGMDADVAGQAKAQVEGDAEPDRTQDDAVMEETEKKDAEQADIPQGESLAATEHTQSYPAFVASQLRPSKPKAPRKSSGWQSLTHGILSAPVLVPASPPPAASGSGTKRKARSSGPAKAVPKVESQSKLEAFGIRKERPVKPVKAFEGDFEDEMEIEEEEPGKAGPSRPAGKKLREIPNAPYHPALRPAGIKAMKQREAAAATARPRTRAQTKGSDRSSSPIPLVDPTPHRPTVRRKTGSNLSPPSSTPPGRSPVSSSLLTDTTEEQDTPEFLREWQLEQDGR